MLGAVENGKWVWGFGDPSPGAFAVTFYYLGLSILGFLVWRKASRSLILQPSGYRPTPARAYWFLLALMLLALGINKQGDLQSLVTVYGREYVRQMGLYDDRRQLQALFIQGVAVAGAIGVLFFMILMRRSSWWCYLSIVGIMVQVVFIIVRATSFHHIDKLIGVRVSELGGVKYNLLFESVGLTLICIGGLGEYFRLRPLAREEWTEDDLENLI